jgi:hypothetical protein
MGTKPIFKHFIDLNIKDFIQYPVWVNCLVVDSAEPWYDDTDDETFRPWLGETPVDPDNGIFLVRSQFRLKDGAVYSGFITPASQKIMGSNNPLGIVQPYIFLDEEKVISFWYGIIKPSKEIVAQLCNTFNKTPDQLFPIYFEAEEGLSYGITSGDIPGLCFLDNGKTIKYIKL